MGFHVVVDEHEFQLAPSTQRRKLRLLAKRLEHEPYIGDRIRHDLVPSRFHDLPNLYRLELPQGWRALYAVLTNEVLGDEVRIVCIGDHTRYERLLGY